MIQRELEHLNFPMLRLYEDMSATRMLVSLVNQWMTNILSFIMTISKIKPSTFSHDSPYCPVQGDFTDEFLHVNILAGPRSIPNR